MSWVLHVKLWLFVGAALCTSLWYAMLACILCSSLWYAMLACYQQPATTTSAPTHTVMDVWVDNVSEELHG